MPTGFFPERRSAMVAALALWAGAAFAHDSWLTPLPRTDRGEAVFAFGTGNQFPQQETGIAMHQVHTSGCQGEGQRAAPMRWVADRPTALVLRSARSVAAGAALSCWAQLQPLPVEIDDVTVEIYLKEVNAQLAAKNPGYDPANAPSPQEDRARKGGKTGKKRNDE